MTDDQIRTLCLDADPFDYWADVAAWRPPALSAPPGPSDPPPAVRLAVIHPIAGGAPGLIDDIISAISEWVWGGMIKPVLNYFLQRLFSATTLVLSGLSSWTKSLLYAMWRWWQSLWWPLMTPHYQPEDEHQLPSNEVSVLTIITSLFRYPVLAVLNKALGWTLWLRDRVYAARDMVDEWITAAKDRLYEIIDWYSNWLRDRVADARDVVGEWITAAKDRLYEIIDWYSNWLRDRVVDARDIITSAVDGARDTVGEWVTAARDFVVDSIFGTVVAGAESLVEGLRDAFDFIFDKVADAIASLGDILVSGFQSIFVGPVDSLINTVHRKLAIPGKVIRGEYPDLIAFLDDLVDPGPAVIAGLVGVIVLGMTISIVTASIMALLVEPLTEPHVQAARAGVGAQLLQPAVLQEARNRGTIDDTLVESHLSRAGYSGPAKEALKDLRHRIPGSSDLVRFAVREAFDPALAAQLGFVTPLPGDFALWMERQGFAEEWAERYWWAHWDLPSVTQGFEMFHRGVIALDDLRLLLRAKDVAPLWQDRLIDIAYTLPSRVDLRRMLKAGIITETDVLKGYTDRGYDPFWARALTDFAVDWSTPEDTSEIDELRQLTASQIRLAYRRHVIDRNEALDRLVEAGYGESSADFLLAVDDAQLALRPDTDADVDVRELTRAVLLEAYREGVWDRDRAQRELEAQGYLPASADLLLTLEDVANARSLTRARTDLIRQRYVTYQIDQAAAAAELSTLGVAEARRNLLLAEWSVDRQAGTRRLSVTDIRRALRAQRITEDDAFVRFLGVGYNPDDAALLIANT